MVLILAGLISLFSTNTFACSVKELTARQRYFARVVLIEAKSKPSWFNHKLSEHPVFVLDSSSSCAGYWIPNEGWSTINANGSYRVNGPYSYIQIYDPKFRQVSYGDTANEPIRKQLQSVLQSSGLNHAMIWAWGVWEPDMNDPKIREYAEKSPDLNASALGVAIHEAMHMFVQHESNKVWTRFGTTSMRDEDLQACYVGTPAIKAIHAQEVEALMKAFTAMTDADTRMFAREFLDLRRQRYTLQSSVTYKDWNGVEHIGDCKENEARQELGEGVPQFTGNALMLDLKLATRQQIADEIRLTTKYYLMTVLQPNQRPIQSYYHTGSISLLLIRQLYRGDFLKLTEQISQPDAKFIVSDLLQQVVDGTLK